MPITLEEMSRWPIVVAPMAGGPTTPALVVAAAEAGAIGFLAAGYKPVETMVAEIDAVRAATSGAFGVNVFVPWPARADAAALAAYLATIGPEAAAVGAAVAAPAWDDDGWPHKLAALLSEPPPIVSFTFGCPPASIVEAFHDRRAAVIVTVTTPAEAAAAVAAGADGVCAEGFEAGGHRGSFTDAGDPADDLALLALLGEIRRFTDRPLIAAGGIGAADAVKAARAAGATAVQAGTAFLRCPEAGTNAVHRAALADPRFTATAVTRAFSGRRARGLVNRFMLEHGDAPSAYPEINNATRALRAAAVARGDADRVNLWAGDAFRSASERPVAAVVEDLAAGFS